jgi:hypothetical protein
MDKAMDKAAADALYPNANPPIAVHISGNKLYIFEFQTNPNLIQDVTYLHMQRVNGQLR